MASTVDQIVARFQRKFPECDAVTALGFFQDAHKRLMSRVQVRNNVQYITLTANVREYPIDPSVFKIHSAYMEQGPDSWWVLEERSTDELNVLQPGWRLPNYLGQPTDYYITSSAVTAGGSDSTLSSAQSSVGFVPIPSTTTSGTYPRIALYCTAYAPLSGSETVPTNLLDDNVYLYRMYEFWGEWTQDMNSAQYWGSLAEKQIDLNRDHVQNLQSQGNGGIIRTVSFMPTWTR